MTDAVRSIDLVPYAHFLSFSLPYCVVRITNLHGRETPYLNHIVICHPGGIGTPRFRLFDKRGALVVREKSLATALNWPVAWFPSKWPF